MIRTVLVTKVMNNQTNETEEIYGRYDAVKLSRAGYSIVGTSQRKYKMSDADFAKYGEKVSEENFL